MAGRHGGTTPFCRSARVSGYSARQSEILGSMVSFSVSRTGRSIDGRCHLAKKEKFMVILLLLLIVLLLAGVGFTAHFLWIAAAALFVLWLVGFALGRGSGGRHRFYRW